MIQGGFLNLIAADPPTQYVPVIFTAVLTSIPLADTLSHIDLLIELLMDLVKRDQSYPEGRETKLKLTDKLAKWINVEVAKLSPLTTYAFLQRMTFNQLTIDVDQRRELFCPTCFSI